MFFCYPLCDSFCLFPNLSQQQLYRNIPFIEFVLTFQYFSIVVVTNSYVQRLTAFFELDQVSSPATPGQSSSSVSVNFFFSFAHKIPDIFQ